MNMRLLLENEKANIYFNEEINSIELIWKSYQDEATYKFVFTQGLKFLIENRASCWLSDIRKEGIVGPGASNWLQQEIIPKALAAGLKKVAVVMDKDIFKEFYVENLGKNSGKLIRYFDTKETADIWLKGEFIEA